MFYFIVSKLPIIAGITDGSKQLKILIIGSICYLVLHALLFSNIGNNIDVVTKMRNYMYYLWAVDGALTVGYLKFFETKKLELEDNSEDEEEEDKSNKKMTREEVIQKLSTMNTTTNTNNNKNQQSPFIKRNESQTPEKPQPNLNSQTIQQSTPPDFDANKEVLNMSDTDIPLYQEKTN